MHYGTFAMHTGMGVTSRQCIIYSINLKQTELCLHGHKHSATDGYPCGFAHDLYELRLLLCSIRTGGPMAGFLAS